MSVVTGHFTLSPEQKRFSELLMKRPSLTAFWDFEKPECNVAALEKRMRSMSHGERLLAAFFLDLWLSDDAKRFDVHDAAATLDADAFAIFQEWVNDPFFP